ncbi:MAG: hypothetical protein AAGB01_02515 [Cyanobacteria bacterium P01_F01_bin.42]
MNKLTKRLAVLLHAVVLTAALSSLTSSDGSTTNLRRDAAQSVDPTDALITISL